MHGLHSNQRKILECLLDTHEGLTLGELANVLQLSKTGVKEHLLKLDNMALICFEDAKGGVGRPRRKYLLTEEGHEVFPRQYSWLSNIVLEFLIEDRGSKAAGKVMKGLGEKVSNSMIERFRKHKTTPALLAEVSSALNELGFKSSVRQSDLRKGAIIEAVNCVYHTVAKEHPELCQFDLAFVANSSGLDVTLQSCIARGGSSCRFCLQKKRV